MSEHIYKRHNKTLLLYHIVFPVKYRKKILTQEVSETLKNICIEISDRYEISFLEIGSDTNYIHFLIQSVPIISITQIVKIIKGITSREIFKTHPEIKKTLWGGNLWTSGFYANTVGQYGNEKIISNYVKRQGDSYNKIHSHQLSLFDML
jgi:putative transposase